MLNTHKVISQTRAISSTSKHIKHKHTQWTETQWMQTANANKANSKHKVVPICRAQAPASQLQPDSFLFLGVISFDFHCVFWYWCDFVFFRIVWFWYHDFGLPLCLLLLVSDFSGVSLCVLVLSCSLCFFPRLLAFFGTVPSVLQKASNLQGKLQ